MLPFRWFWLVATLLAAAPSQYEDGRPEARLRMEASDQGVVLRHGGAPADCDRYGARDVWVYESEGTWYMHYDAAGPTGWLTALATSRDLVNWRKQGTVLSLGGAGEDDSASASYGVTYRAGRTWHMFYLGTPNTSPPPARIPSFPYMTLKEMCIRDSSTGRSCCPRTRLVSGPKCSALPESSFIIKR